MAKTLKYRTKERLFYSDVDNNFDALGHYSGVWSAGVYDRNEIVSHNGGVFICLTKTSQDPSASNDWEQIPNNGRGGLKSNGSVTGPNLGATYATLPFARIHLPGIGMSLTTSTVVFNYPGIWSISLLLYFDHDESASARTTNLRLYNVTKSVAAESFAVPIAKNQESTFLPITFDHLALPVDAGDTFRLEAGGGSTVSSVVWQQTFAVFEQVSASLEGFPTSAGSATGLAYARAIGSTHQAVGSASGSSTSVAVGHQDQSHGLSEGGSTALGVGGQQQSNGSSAGTSLALAYANLSKGTAFGTSTANSIAVIPKP